MYALIPDKSLSSATKQANSGRKIFIVVCAVIVVLMVIGVAGLLFMPKQVMLNQVTLKSGPFNDTVQMFERVGLGDEGVVTHFSSGTSCTKVNGPSAVDFGDSDILYFNKLTCDGITGYVNAKWVNN